MILLGICTLLVVGCGSSTDDPTGTPSATPKLTRAEAEQLAGFAILLPSALPAKVDPTPEYKALGARHGIDVFYYPQGNSHDPESPSVHLHEQNTGTLVPNGPFVTEAVGATAVQISEVDRNEVAGFPATITWVWSQGELKLSATFLWGSETDLVDLTDEFRAVARRFAESIINSPT